MVAAMLKYWMLASRNLLLFGLLPVVAGSVVGLRGWEWSRDASAFVENLRETEGRVAGIVPNAGGLSVAVEYWDETGVRFEKQFGMDSRQDARLKAVGKVSLVYDVRHPQVAELGHAVSANNERLLFVGITVAGFLLALTGVAMIGSRVKATALTLALFRSGTLVQTEVRDSVLAPGAKKGRFTYAFRGPNGRWHDGSSPELPAEQLIRWEIGRRIVVAYDPGNPQRSEPDVFGVVGSKRRGAMQAA